MTLSVNLKPRGFVFYFHKMNFMCPFYFSFPQSLLELEVSQICRKRNSKNIINFSLIILTNIASLLMLRFSRKRVIYAFIYFSFHKLMNVHNYCPFGFNKNHMVYKIKYFLSFICVNSFIT